MNAPLVFCMVWAASTLINGDLAGFSDSVWSSIRLMSLLIAFQGGINYGFGTALYDTISTSDEKTSFER